MAIQHIVEMIDAYIKQLKSARTLLVEQSNSLHSKDRHAVDPQRKQKQVATKSAAAPSTVTMVEVQVLPPKLPRNSRGSVRSGTTEHTALGGSIPQGPVVVRRAEVAQNAAKAKQSEPVPSSGGILQELAQEVARRLGQNGKTRLVVH